MIDKRVESLEEAVAGIDDGAVVLIWGFGHAGSPTDLIHALIDKGAKDLTIVNNNAGNGHIGLAALLEIGRVRKMICTYPRATDSEVITDLYRNGKIELEIVPQGTLSERLRSAGSGIGGFIRRRQSARHWPTARKCGQSTARIMSLNFRCRQILRLLKPKLEIVGAT